MIKLDICRVGYASWRVYPREKGTMPEPRPSYEGTSRLNEDVELAKMIGLDNFFALHNKMIVDFGAYETPGYIRFPTRKQAVIALKWLEPRMVAFRLIGK